jgi:O-antigen ligase
VDSAAYQKEPVVKPRKEKGGSSADPSLVRVTREDLKMMAALIGVAIAAYAFPSKPLKYALLFVLGSFLFSTAFTRPGRALALLAFFIPAMVLVPNDLIPIPGMNFETIFGVFGLFLWMRANQLHGPDRIHTSLGRLLVVYAVLTVLSCFQSWMLTGQSLGSLLPAAKNYLIWMMFLPISFHVARERKDQVLVLVLISLTLFLNSAQAIDKSWLAFVTGSLERNRAGALLAAQPNLFGGVLALFLPLFAVLAINRIGSKHLNRWFLLCALAIGFALLLTLSRGAWLGAAVGLVAVASLKDKRLLLILVLLAVGWRFWVPQQAVDRAAATMVTEESNLGAQDQVFGDSTQMRVEQYKSLPAMFSPHPIFGWGFNSFPQVFGEYGTLGRPKGAHSTYLLVAVEQGTIGLLMLALVFIHMGRLGWRATKICRDPFHRYIGLGLFGGAVSMAVCMASGNRFGFQAGFAYYWFLAGIAERELKLELERRASAARERTAGP